MNDDCLKYSELLELYCADETTPEETRRVEEHLFRCSACREEVRELRELFAAAASAGDEALREADAVDWQAVHSGIHAAIERRPARKLVAMPRPLRRPLAWAAALVVAIAGWQFVQLWHGGGSPTPPLPLVSGLDNVAANNARRDVVAYLQEGQMVLSELLHRCNDESAAGSVGFYTERAAKLLQKRKYLNDDLQYQSLAKARPVAERLEWVWCEIAQLTVEDPCGQLSTVRRVVERENLLLKMRMLEQELSVPTYSEV